MGAGLAAKAVLDGRISLISFGVAQVLIDLEPGVRMLTGQGELHGWSHTVAGALAAGTLATVIAPRLIPPIVRRWNQELAHYRQHWLTIAPQPRQGAVATGAFVGTFSHLLLDGFMHADMHPLAPFTLLNPWLHWLQHGTVYALCAAVAAASAALWLVRKAVQHRWGSTAAQPRPRRPPLPRR